MEDQLDLILDDWTTLHHAASKSELKPTLNRVDFSDREKATIVLMGDTHIGSRYYDEELHKRDLDWCGETETPIILMGDSIEAATRDSVGAGVYEQQEIIDTQIAHFEDLYRPLVDAGLILGLHSGNHEGRVYKSCGFDIAKMMAKDKLGVPYFGWAKLHYIRVGGQGYTMYTTHGGSGARMPHTKIKAAIDLSNMVDAEIYAMGHLHQLSHHVRQFYRANKRNKTVDDSQKHFILTGSYLTHWGSYAHLKGMEPMRKGSAKVKLHGDEKMVRVSL